jgi:DNA-binding MltR family transcriptional regulator
MGQVPFVEDADKATKDMQAQRAERAKESAMMFATVPLKDTKKPAPGKEGPK